MKTAEVIRAALDETRLSQRELADAAGISESALSNILAGRRAPSVRVAEAILSVLRTHTGRKRGLTLNDLFSATGKGRAA